MPMDLKREMEEAKKRGDERIRGTTRLRAYTLDGQVAFEVGVQPGNKPHDQIRTISGAQALEARRLGFQSVDDCDRAGRSDLVRCFLYDPMHPPCYREVRGGHDRYPNDAIDEQFAMDFRDYPWLQDEMQEILKVFPDEEIAPFEAVVLAWLRREFAAQVKPEDAGPRFEKMLKDTGFATRFSPRRVADHVARMPALQKRYEELKAKQAAKP